MLIVQAKASAHPPLTRELSTAPNRCGLSLQRTTTMLDSQNQGPQCTACGSPMKLAAIEPSDIGQDLRTYSCPRCKRVQRHVIESSVTAAWLAPKK
jgi:hypothetical protein